MGFLMENTDKDLIKLDESLRFRSIKEYQPTVTTLITQEQFIDMITSNADPVFKESVITDVLWGGKYLKNTAILR